MENLLFNAYVKAFKLFLATDSISKLWGSNLCKTNSCPIKIQVQGSQNFTLLRFFVFPCYKKAVHTVQPAAYYKLNIELHFKVS